MAHSLGLQPVDGPDHHETFQLPSYGVGSQPHVCSQEPGDAG